MVASNVRDIYETHVKSLEPVDRLRLVELIARDMTGDLSSVAPRQRSLLDLEGVGAELWEGVDAQQYVNELRKEWDHRP